MVEGGQYTSRTTVKSVDFAQGCDRFPALFFSATVRVPESTSIFSEGSRPDTPESTLFGIGNLPVKENRALKNDRSPVRTHALYGTTQEDVWHVRSMKLPMLDAHTV